MKIGFDNEKYLKIQSEHIKERIAKFNGKLYLELGGKLFDDHHASRVLPGFKPDSKLRMFAQLRDQLEIVIVVSAEDIEKNKVRADLGITYDEDVLRLREEFMNRDFMVGSVVITHYNGQNAADQFRHRLERMGIKSYVHYLIDGYPHNVELIASDDGFGKNDYVETSRELVIVTAPGPGSGKMAVCLSQLYNENKRGIQAGYAKFETFPVWSLPLKHPVNIAYEAATADLNDVNMIDPFHLEAYGKTAVNYNRDVEVFPVVNAILESVSGKSPYSSPTDMGVNMAGFCIVDDDKVRKAAENEIIRRYFGALRDHREGKCDESAVFKLELCMKRAGITPSCRRTVTAVREYEDKESRPIVAMELKDGAIVTGKASALLTASSAMILNALKIIADIDDSVLLISPEVIKSMQRLKVEYLGNRNPRLHIDEMLVALSIAANVDSNAERAFSALPALKGCDAHSSVVISPVDEGLYKKLGIYVSCEPEYQTKCLFHGNRGHWSPTVASADWMHLVSTE